MNLLIEVAREDYPDNPVDHVFGTVLSGIYSAVQVGEKFDDYASLKESRPELYGKLVMNKLSKQEAIRLVIRAIVQIGDEFEEVDIEGKKVGSMDRMKELWETDPKNLSGAPEVIWMGGGRRLSEVLGKGGELLNPFVDFDD